MSEKSIPEILSEETGRPVEDFIADLDEYPLPGLDDLVEVDVDE